MVLSAARYRAATPFPLSPFLGRSPASRTLDPTTCVWHCAVNEQRAVVRLKLHHDCMGTPVGSNDECRSKAVASGCRLCYTDASGPCPLPHQLRVEACALGEHHCTKARGSLEREAMLRRRATHMVLWRLKHAPCCLCALLDCSKEEQKGLRNAHAAWLVRRCCKLKPEAYCSSHKAAW